MSFKVNFGHSNMILWKNGNILLNNFSWSYKLIQRKRKFIDFFYYSDGLRNGKYTFTHGNVNRKLSFSLKYLIKMYYIWKSIYIPIGYVK